MAFLVPLLLPSIIDATANVALGVTNAIQGTSSSITFQIGNKVYTSAKPFPFHKLPPEIREEIILMALEGSRDLIQQAILVARPFALAPNAIPMHNPLDPSSPHYRSIRGEWKSANGYPVSAWKWLTLSREWRGVLRKRLWRDVVIDSGPSYERFLKFLEDGQVDDVLSSMHRLELDQGFEDPSDIYPIFRHPKLINLRKLSILSSWPYSSNIIERPAQLFKFGLQLIPAPPAKPLKLTTGDGTDTPAEDEREKDEDVKRLDCFTFGLPLEMATNEVSRKHLAVLKPKRLEITLIQPNMVILTELAGLLADKIDEISIRYLSSERAPFGLCDPGLLVSEMLDHFKKVDLHLPQYAAPLFHKTYPGQPNPDTSFSQRAVELASIDGERSKRYQIWIEAPSPVMGRPVWGSVGEDVIWERREEQPEDASKAVTVLFDMLSAEDEKASGEEKQPEPSGWKEEKPKVGEKGKAKDENPVAPPEHWERQTNLKLFGGLVSLRLESKKH